MAFDLRKAELRWLAQQPQPVWGGHLDRGEPITNRQLLDWVGDGLVEAVEEPCRGYVITEAGRKWAMEK